MKQPLALEKWHWQQRYVWMWWLLSTVRGHYHRVQHQHVFSGALKLPS